MSFTMPTQREQKKLNPRTDPHSPWLHLDPVIALCALGLSVISVLMIYSSTRGRDFENFDTSFRDRQMMFVVAGVGLMFVVALIDYRMIMKWVWGIFGGAVVLLGLVLHPALGSTDASGLVRPWFRFGPVSLQPPEPAKLAVIIGLAWWISRSDGEMETRDVGIALVIAGIPMLLINEQPDLGTMLVFAVITAGMLLVGGASARDLLVLVMAAVTVGYFQISRLASFQRDRLTSFVDPSVESNYNVEQAQIAIGNGGLTGTGLGNGTQTTSGLVPEQHTDFIFTVIGEELGFVGGIATIALFAVLILRIFRTTIIAGDQFGSLVSAGVLSMIVFQVFQSIGMTMGIMPVTGIPLPFVSYGGSSAITSFGGIGLVISIHMRRYQAAIDPTR